MTSTFKLTVLQPIDGYLHGLRQRSVRVKVEVLETGLSLADIAVAYRALRPICPANPVCDIDFEAPHGHETDGLAAADGLIRLSGAICEAAAGLMREPPKLLNTKIQTGIVTAEFLAPAMMPTQMAKALQGLNKILLDAQKTGFDAQLETAKALINDLRAHAPSGSNARGFIAAAYELGLDHDVLERDLVRYGFGRSAVHFNSSLTNTTSAIAARICKDKALTNQVLNECDVPVAKRQYRGSQDGLRQKAEQLEFPLVLKPRALDQGQHVYIGMKTREELTNALDAMAKNYKGPVTVESYVAGDIYRINVVDGAVLRAVRRFSSGVIGDGVSTLKQLAERENAQPYCDADDPKKRNPIVFTPSVIEHMKSKGLTVDQVPENGRFIPRDWLTSLQTPGNVVDFLPDLHPSYIDLCIEACDVIGLDVAGIDLISQDATKPWWDVGAVICEINAVPQFSSSDLTIHKNILTKRVDPARPLVGFVGLTKAQARKAIQSDTNLSDAELVNLSPNKQLVNALPVARLTKLICAPNLAPNVTQAIHDRFSDNIDAT